MQNKELKNVQDINTYEEFYKLMGVAEEYPAAVLEAQQRKNAYNRGLKKGRAQAKPNCGGPNCY